MRRNERIHFYLIAALAILFLIVFCVRVAQAQTTYTVYTGLQYDEGFGMRPSNGAAGWKGWNILGPTDIPYDLCDQYPDDAQDNAIQRLILDTQDLNIIHPRIYVSVGDTGRIVRMQLKDGAVALDLTGYTVTISSWTQDDDTPVRVADDMSHCVTDTDDGFIEWILDSTKDTVESVYLTVKCTKVGYEYLFPTDGYLYIDCENKQTASASYSSGVTVPRITIKAGGWLGKTVRFKFYDGLRDAIDLSAATVAMNYAAKAAGPTFFNASSCDYTGICQWVIDAGKYSSADIYPLFWKLTSPSGEIIYVPSQGHVILEAK